jgi:hypothetical protein
MPPSHYRPPITSPTSSPSNRALTSINGFNSHSSPPLLRPPLQRPPRPYKTHPEDPRSTLHITALLPSPLLRRNASPPSFSDCHRAATTPGRHTAARAPVSHPPHSSRPTPPLPPLGRRPWTPERSEVEAPASPVPPSTAGPPWTGIPVVHGPVDPVYGKFFMKIIR